MAVLLSNFAISWQRALDTVKTMGEQTQAWSGVGPLEVHASALYHLAVKWEELAFDREYLIRNPTGRRISAYMKFPVNSLYLNYD